MDTTAFADGLGRRFPARGTEGERLECLRLCTEITATPATQAALVERAARLSHFHHPSFARVRRIERVGGIAGGLAVVSEASDGVRLSDLLRQAERRLTDRNTDAALDLLHQAVSAIAALHAHSGYASHGAIGPERLIVRPDGQVVVTEYVLAGALEQLELSRLQLWSLFRVPVPPAASTVPFDQQTDVFQLGVLALALALGRVLRRDDFPLRLVDVLEEASAADGLSGYPGLPRPVRWWIGRALQFDSRTAFRSAIQAKEALSAALSEDGAPRASSSAAVQLLLANCSFSVLSPRDPPSERRSPSGAVVAVGRARDVAAGAGTESERTLDRGSGAHRVARQALEPDAGAVQVLADVSHAPAAVDQHPMPPPEDVQAGGEAPEEVAPVRAWLSRLPALRAAFGRSARRKA